MSGLRSAEGWSEGEAGTTESSEWPIRATSLRLATDLTTLGKLNPQQNRPVQALPTPESLTPTSILK